MLIEDKELGQMTLLPNARAKRVIARVRNGELHITHPTHIGLKEVQQAIDTMRPQLLALLKRTKPKFVLAPDSECRTSTFVVQIVLSNLTKVYSELNDGVLRISMPNSTNFHEEVIQVLLRRIVETYMRKEANRIFPKKVEAFAQELGFRYNTVKINKSRSRWGSCSMKRAINLSYFCLLLPDHLIDYVILHELCHTVEMNHGDQFWLLLDKVTTQKAKSLSKELKGIAITWV